MPPRSLPFGIFFASRAEGECSYYPLAPVLLRNPKGVMGSEQYVMQEDGNADAEKGDDVDFLE